MKCEHGKEVHATVEIVSPPWWDDGIHYYDKHGIKEPSTVNVCHLLIHGCDYCKTIRVIEAEVPSNHLP
jgi:hypothetical protein